MGLIGEDNMALTISDADKRPGSLAYGWARIEHLERN